MAEPTIESRLQRRFILMTSDAELAADLRATLPPGWQLTEASSLSEVGEFQDVLLHRFILLDLDETAAFDPLEVISELRGELMLNVPVFCFGGDPARRDEARLARADRFFEREEMIGRMLQFCEQYRWGEED